MRAVVQRVSRASVSVRGETLGAVGRGFLVLLGIGEDDTGETSATSAARSPRCGSLRIRRAG